jgi:hypothetical protein
MPAVKTKGKKKQTATSPRYSPYPSFPTGSRILTTEDMENMSPQECDETLEYLENLKQRQLLRKNIELEREQDERRENFVKANENPNTTKSYAGAQAQWRLYCESKALPGNPVRYTVTSRTFRRLTVCHDADI